MSESSDYRPLDAMTARLDGVGLVEANAGTGKTYNIVTLYLRLLLEASLTVDRILVVSFTDAATAELRERIRRRLSELQAVFATGRGDAEQVRFLAACPDREKALRRIVRALQSFDQAAIYTIHGFCQRLLADAAFEAGMSQTTELITDDNAIRRQLINDFWHAETAAGSRLWIRYLLANAQPDRLYRQLARYFARPLMRRISEPEPAASAELEEAFVALYRQAQRDWRAHREAVIELLLEHRDMNRTQYRESTLEKLAGEVDRWFGSGGARFHRLEKLAKLGTERIEAGVKKGGTPPRHALFDRFQELLDLGRRLEPVFAQRLVALRGRLLDFAGTELRRRKEQWRVRHFDDLLGDVHAVLQSGQAATLQQAVTQQYGAALIDEFQDTDPVQFSIFDSLFCHNQTPVFFVGDPKQAIYGFRGADVYAYLDARDRANRRFRLDLNYRSTPRLVECVNRVFERPKNPFVIGQIDFHPSAAACAKTGLIVDGKEQPAMRWWQLPSNAGKPLAVGEAEKQTAESVATEIVRLLQLILDRRIFKPENEALEAKDIAVLVNTHKQGRLVRDALERRGVACMQRTEDNVFQTPEADELYYVLRAVVEPSRHPLVRAALATELLGYDAQQIDAIDHDDRRWQDLLDRFAEYPEIWRRYGFARMCRRLMQDFDVQRRLLALTHGQRRVTNLLHLADLLQHESDRRHGRLDEVLVWMREQKNIDRPSDQAMLLRLDSDENLVNITTVHFSKGLQFPVVFCPYLWSTFKFNDPALVEFHDRDNRPTLDLHLEQDSAYAGQASIEQLAERVRLAYVALTRAELACCAVWGATQGMKGSSLNWLLHAGAGADANPQQPAPATEDDVSRAMRRLNAGAMTAGAMPAASSQKLSTAPARQARPRARVLQRPVPAGWRVSSFSALTRQVIEEPRDYDAGKSADAPEPLAPQGIFAFPRGARAGHCMHALLEKIDFGTAQAGIEPVARQVLAEHGFDVNQSPVLADMAVNVLATNLSESAPVCLRDVAAGARVAEMEFYFPCTGLDAAALRAALGEFGDGTAIETRLSRLEFRVAGGFMHGFIDLVFEADDRFYLVDYKSNWLGSEPADYRLDKLQREIARHDYYLQYLIYGVALHRYLTATVPDYDYDRHFGGAYYLFLRGMHPRTGSEYGVFYDRPDRATLLRLEKLFCGKGIDR